MTRARSGWLVYLPLLAAGCLASHWAAYAVAGDRHPGAVLGGHADLALALAGSLLLAGFVAHGLDGATAVRLPVAAALPPATFALQEHLERVFHGHGAATTALEPAFLVGLALQVPFALGAVVLARALTALAHAIGRALSRRSPVQLRRIQVLRPPAARDTAAATPEIAYAGRAPPPASTPA